MLQDRGKRGPTPRRPRKKPAQSATPAWVQPLTTQAEPFRIQRRAQQQKTRRAARKVPANPSLERIPIKTAPVPERWHPPERVAVDALSNPGAYSNRETTHIFAALRRAREAVGAKSNRDLYLSSNLDERRYLRTLGRAVVASQQTAGVLASNRPQDQYRSPAPGQAHDTKIAGFPIEAAGEALSQHVGPRGKAVAAPFAVAVNLARATAEDPVAVAKSSVRTAVESVAGIPQGVKAIIDNPGKALDAIGKDYEDRYGNILNNPAEFRRHVKDTYGLTPYALDLTALAGGTGQAAGAVARTGAAGRAAAALSETRGLGAVGRALHAVHGTATMQRPRLRFTGGEGGAKPQATSRNLFVAGAQRGVDTARRRRYRNDLQAAGVRETTGGRLVEAVPGQPGTGRLPGVRPGKGEVLPYYSLRETAPLRRYTGRVARDIGAEKSKGRLRLLTNRGRVLAQIDKHIKTLNDNERLALKYAVQLGVRHGDQGTAALRNHLETIKANRAKAGDRKIAPVLHATNDEVPVLERILANPDAHLTDRLGQVADEVRAIQRQTEGMDPDLPAARASLRRNTPQGETLGVRRHVADETVRARVQVEDRFKAAKAARSQARRHVKTLETELATAKAVDRIGKLRRLADRPGTGPERVAAQEAVARLAAKHGLDPNGPLLARDARQISADLDTARQALTAAERRHADIGLQRQSTPSAAKRRLRTAERDLARAKEDLKHAQGRSEVLSEGLRVGSAAQAPSAGGKGIADARAAVDAAKTHVQAAKDAFKQAKRVAREDAKAPLETADQFDERVRTAAQDAGLAEPGYWMSSKRPQTEYSLAAVGSGGRATARSKAYKGSLFRVGAEEHHPDVLVRGIERNIKRRFQWSLVNRNMDVHAFEWSRGQAGEGRTAADILRELDDRRIDANTVAFVNPGVLRRRAPDTAGVERGSIDATGDLPDDAVLHEVHQDLIDARTTIEDLQAEQARGLSQNRYLVVPKTVADELQTMSRPDSGLMRGMEILLKQKPSRILLGALNVPWLSFQVASNAFLTGLGGAPNPLDVYGSHKWWRGLTPEQKDAVELELGITHGHHFAAEQTRLGSTVRNAPAGVRHLIDFYAAYKASRVGRLAHKANPLDAMFKADEAQNNFFRKVLFYNQAKKTAYDRIGANWRSLDGIQKKLMSTLSLPPERMGAKIAQRGAEFDQHARHVKDFLGDYLTFSDAERRLLSRNVMFYGYLRYSLRFAFYTMPVQHPVMTAILSDIGRMGAQEIKDLFDVPNNYRLPTSILASVYTGRYDKKTGMIPSIPIGRLNPGLNAITQLESEQQLVGLVSPLYQAVADQLFEESSFTGRDWTINGQPTPSAAERPKNYYGSAFGAVIPGRPRNRILMRDLLSLAYPYRVAEKTGIPGTGIGPLEGPQSDDSLLWSPRPIRYKDPALKRKIRRSTRADLVRKAGGGAVLDQVFPLVRPQYTAAVEAVKRERQKEADQANRRMGVKKRRKRSTAASYGGTAKGSGYGGSSTSTKSRYGG